MHRSVMGGGGGGGGGRYRHTDQNNGSLRIYCIVQTTDYNVHRSVMGVGGGGGGGIAI